MKIIVLGSSSSGNCYRISDGKTALLLDAGLSLPKIKEGVGYRLSEISACLISHSHGDHVRGAEGLSRFGIDLYASPETIKEAEFVGHRFHPVEAGRAFTVGTLEIVPFDLHHDVRCYGYLVESAVTGERLVYITDTAYTDYTFPALTHAMVEANYSKELLCRDAAITPAQARRLEQTHMEIGQTLDLLQANNKARTLRQIYLLHLSDRHADAAGFKRRVQEACGCEVYVAAKRG